MSLFGVQSFDKQPLSGVHKSSEWKEQAACLFRGLLTWLHKGETEFSPVAFLSLL